MSLFGNYSSAVFSQDRKYRYRLWRIWDESLPLAMCIGLNPSTASEVKPDPTISNLIIMLKRLGYGGFYMMNLFAIVSSKPEILLTCEDPLGENDEHLDEVREICEDVIFCWGDFKQAKERAKIIMGKYRNALCFGTCKSGAPVHPLAMMYAGSIKTATLIPFSNEESKAISKGGV